MQINCSYNDQRQMASLLHRCYIEHFEQRPRKVYDGSGNMTQNSRVSADYLGYDASQPHAVSSVRATEGSISPSRCEAGYNSRNRPAYITEEDWRLAIAYGGGLQREKSVLTQDGSPVRTTLFISGDCEHEETPTFSRYIDYIKVGGQTVALHFYNETADLNTEFPMELTTKHMFYTK